jgi:hypothetical protein
MTSVLLNLTKFLETTARWGERVELKTGCQGDETIDTRVMMRVTSLRINTTYIHVFSLIR